MSPSLLFAQLDTISNDSTPITIEHSFRKPMAQQRQTDISVSAVIPPILPGLPGKLSSPAGRGSCNHSTAVGNACVTQGRCSQGLNCQLSFSGSHFLPPPGPTRGKLKETLHKKAIYLASHFLDLLSNYFSYLCLNETFLRPCPVPFCFTG